MPEPLRDALRVVRADNPGPFTLDGTRSYIVGRSRPAVIDPGPDVPDHVRAVVRALLDPDPGEGADPGGRRPTSVILLLTHGHGDHAGAVDGLRDALSGRDVSVRVVGPGHPRSRPPSAGEEVVTDAGALTAVPTPGHTPDHVAWHWPERSAAFPGDTVLGAGETTWVAGHPGCVADYLASLDRLRALAPRHLLPTHGPPIEDPGAALDRFEAHRRERIEQVRAARRADPDATPAELVDRIYGDAVPEGLLAAAVESVEAVLDHLERSRRS